MKPNYEKSVMEKKFKFTHNRLLALEPQVTRYHCYDTEQPGLRIQVTPNGTKTFQFRMWSPNLGKPLLRTIGKLETVSIKEARLQALQLAADVNSGQDIEAERRAKREEMTFAEIFESFINNHAKAHRSSWPEDQRTFKIHMAKSFGSKRVDWITSDLLRAWHAKIGESSGKVAANRALGLISSIFTHELPDKKNPASGVKKFPEASRDRFLQPNELAAFFQSLAEEPNQEIKDFFMLLLLTGARKSNVMAMRWSQVDLTNDVWAIPADESKNSQKINVPLVPDAKAILTKRKSQTSSFFVFPSSLSTTGHIINPNKAWRRIISRAKLEDVRIHDLRRTMGSFMAAGNASTVIIGKALGHTDPTATAIYSRLNLDPVRQAMEKAVTTMLSTFSEQEIVSNE